MVDARPGVHTVGSIAAQLGGRLVGPAGLAVTHLESLDHGGPGTLSFIRSREFAAKWASCAAPAALVSEGIEVGGHDPSTRALIYVKDADLAMVTLLGMFMPAELSHRRSPGVHPSAVIDLAAKVSPLAHIGPHCVVEGGAEIADGVTVAANCFVGAGARIGTGTTLHPGVVVLARCTVGRGCILWPNVTIGADGFGYRPAPADQVAATGGLVKIPHVGTVEIGDLVEIGANTSVDRGKFGATVIGAGTKIDNHVQIGHNVRIGRACVICGCCGLGGSAVLGDGVIVSGHAGIKDGIRIGSRATVLAKSAVMTDIGEGERWMGYPARPLREFVALEGIFNRMASVPSAIKRLFRGME